MIFSANKVINILKDDIEANFDPGIECRVYNFYGLSSAELERKFVQPGSIIIIYNGCPYDKESTGYSMKGMIQIQFIVVEQTLATAKRKDDFLLDKFRDFIVWQKFDELNSEYPESDMEPFFPEDETLLSTTEAGISQWSFIGYIQFVKRNIGG